MYLFATKLLKHKGTSAGLIKAHIYISIAVVLGYYWSVSIRRLQHPITTVMFGEYQITMVTQGSLAQK